LVLSRIDTSKCRERGAPAGTSAAVGVDAFVAADRRDRRVEAFCLG
jgi:hypothetical protein